MKQSILRAFTVAIGLLVMTTGSSAQKLDPRHIKSPMPLTLIDVSGSVDPFERITIDSALRDVAAYVRAAGGMPYRFWGVELSPIQTWDGDEAKIPALIDKDKGTFVAPALKAAQKHLQLCAGLVLLVDDAPIFDEDEYRKTLEAVLQSDIAVHVLIISSSDTGKLKAKNIQNEQYWVQLHREFITHSRYEVGSLRDKTLADAYNWVREHTVPCIA